MRILRRLLIGFAVAVGLIAVLPWVGYWNGLRSLPEDRAPDSFEGLPPLVTPLFWSYYTTGGQATLAHFNPWTVAAGFGSPAYMFAHHAGRALMLRSLRPAVSSMKDVPNSNSATIWISRNWTAEEAIATIMKSSSFAHGTFGIEEASRMYFGVGVQELPPYSLAQLVAVGIDSARYDLWCEPEANETAVERILGRARIDENERRNVLSPPDSAC